MELKLALDRLRSNPDFQQWLQQNNAFFSYAFTMVEDQGEGVWQLGYYIKKEDKARSFVIEHDKITATQNEEVFKKPDANVLELEIKKVKLSFAQIMDALDVFQRKHYPHEMPMKTIVILQNIEKLGNVWNITTITKSFKTINVKVNAADGKILDYHIDSIFDFQKK